MNPAWQGHMTVRPITHERSVNIELRPRDIGDRVLRADRDGATGPGDEVAVEREVEALHEIHARARNDAPGAIKRQYGPVFEPVSRPFRQDLVDANLGIQHRERIIFTSRIGGGVGGNCRDLVAFFNLAPCGILTVLLVAFHPDDARRRAGPDEPGAITDGAGYTGATRSCRATWTTGSLLPDAILPKIIDHLVQLLNMKPHSSTTYPCVMGGNSPKKQRPRCAVPNSDH